MSIEKRDKKSLDILALSDLHYMGAGEEASAVPARHYELSAIFLEKALRRLQHEGISVDLIILAGDVIKDGDSDYAESDLTHIAGVLKSLGTPFLVVPGNHDGDQSHFIEHFGCEPGLHQFGDYGFVLFHDQVDEGNVTTRSEEDISLLQKYALENPDLSLIAIQHNPLHPDIDNEYPFMLTNRDKVMAGYMDAEVILSISGHYHAGQPAHKLLRMTGTETCPTVSQHSDLSCRSVAKTDAEMTVYTLPAIFEAPFRFAHIKLIESEVVITEKSLKMEIPGLIDTHCHSEFAYCGTTVNAEMNIDISRAMGLQRQYFTEHAFHLYFDRDVALSFSWQEDATLVDRAWSKPAARMEEFRQLAASVRSDFVRVGLELDLRKDGSLLLADEDRDGWDIFIGAVHSIPGLDIRSLSEKEVEKAFLEQTEQLLSHPIQVLAHPFRFFKNIVSKRPRHLYKVVAEMLAASGVASEINFHVNIPDPYFVEECLSRGVKIALGTDSHALWEVGEMTPHLMVLRAAGARDNDLKDILFQSL